MTEEAPKKRGRPPATIACIAKRRMGVAVPVSEEFPDGSTMVEPGTEVKLPRDVAIRLQDAGVIKVVI